MIKTFIRKVFSHSIQHFVDRLFVNCQDLAPNSNTAITAVVTDYKNFLINYSYIKRKECSLGSQVIQGFIRWFNRRMDIADFTDKRSNDTIKFSLRQWPIYLFHRLLISY